ncbi:MAG: DUF1553 domain-containing protein [Thermoguttaceae bacterium]|jgi:hypothetical protein
MKTFLLFAVVLTAATADRGATRAPVFPFESLTNLASQGKIDELVFGKLRHLGIPPAPICSDAVFVRRVYLDVIGTLPTAQETKEFLSNQNPKKRRILIDRLLERKEFADYWAMKWSDLLRVKSEYPINLWPNAVQSYHRWIRTCIKDNMPYDRFVREMLTANGSNFNVPQVNFYRAIQGREPTAIAQAVALSFMGVRAEGWPKERWAEMGLFFSRIQYKATEQWKEEIVIFDPGKDSPQSAADAPVEAVFPDGTTTRLSPGQDPREVFVNWLVAPKNPWFARNIVNRIWSWLLGRGIIHEPDDIRPDNPAINPELLAYLERELISARFDLKHVFRLILNSKTYQLSSIPEGNNPLGEANFSYYPPRRLEAEVLIDAIDQITGTTEKYTSPIPEPFTFIPESQRSIELADGSISSSFLEMFGRPARDTGLESERNNRSTADQELHLLNSTHIRRKIEQSQKLRELLQAKKKPREIVEELYLTILSRYPTDEELEIVREYAQPGHEGRRPMMDLIWALINSAEFLYRH